MLPVSLRRERPQMLLAPLYPLISSRKLPLTWILFKASALRLPAAFLRETGCMAPGPSLLALLALCTELLGPCSKMTMPGLSLLLRRTIIWSNPPAFYLLLHVAGSWAEGRFPARVCEKTFSSFPNNGTPRLIGLKAPPMRFSFVEPRKPIRRKRSQALMRRMSLGRGFARLQMPRLILAI